MKHALSLMVLFTINSDRQQRNTARLIRVEQLREAIFSKVMLHENRVTQDKKTKQKLTGSGQKTREHSIMLFRYCVFLLFELLLETSVHLSRDSVEVLSVDVKSSFELS